MNVDCRKKHIDILLILSFAIVTWLSFLLDNKLIYFLLGCVCCFLFYHKVIYRSSYILSLFFLLYHPFSLTFGQTGIPLLGAVSILGVHIIVLFKILLFGNGIKVHRRDAHSIAFILLFGLLLLFKWFLSDFSVDGFQHVYKFWGFGILPYILFIKVINRQDDFDSNMVLSQKIFISYLLSFLLLFCTVSDFHEVICRIDNPISLGFFILSNAIITFSCMLKRKKIGALIVLLVSFFLLFAIGQRSILIGAALFAVIFFMKSSLSVFTKFAYSFLTFVCVCLLINILPDDLGYKFNYFLSFFSDMKSYISLIPYYGSELHEQLGTIGTRLYLWYSALINTNFFVGSSLGSYMGLTGYSYPHNIFLEFYYLFGFIGVLTLLVMGIKYAKLIFSREILYSKISYISAIVIVLLTILLFSSSISGLFVNLLLYLNLLQRYIFINCRDEHTYNK